MDALTILNDDLTLNGFERKGEHRWVKDTPDGQMQVQAGAELNNGRLVVFTGRFRNGDHSYTTGGAFMTDCGAYCSLLEALDGNEQPRRFHYEGISDFVSELLNFMEREANNTKLLC